MIRVFISAVSDEFGTYRDRLAKDLSAPAAIEVIRQEGLAASGTHTLLNLDDYIRACDAVIHLLGDQAGMAPPSDRDEVPELLRRHPDLTDRFKLDPAVVGALTRTQWEAWLAVYHGKRLYVARPTPCAPRDRPIADANANAAAEARKVQAEHWSRLVGIRGRDCIEFANPDSLVNAVHVALHTLRELTPDRKETPADPAALAHLSKLRERILRDPNSEPLDEPALEAIDRHLPTTLEEYHLRQIAHWSRAVYRIDRRFTPLALRLDVEDEKAQPYDDLRQVLDHLESNHHCALTVIGPPGAGKSTLLRRLGYDRAIDALRSGPEKARTPFYVELRSFELTRDCASPRAWLAGQWRARNYERVGDFDAMLNGGRLLLLLDAINEMPCSADEYETLLGKWSEFIAHDNLPAGNQVVFTCRRMDYSIGLQIEKKTIPHVEVESLGPDKIREFLEIYLPGRKDLVEGTIATLETEKTFELYNSPFYLTLLVELVEHGGAVPRGRAGLFSAFVRKAVQRELGSNRRFARDGPLLSADDFDQVRDGDWPDDHALPADSAMFPGLAALACEMQARGGAAQLSRRRALRIGKREALGILNPPPGSPGSADDLLAGAIDLHLLEFDRRTRDVQFRHQLFQEYFAARKLAADLAEAGGPASEAGARSIAELARQPWRADEIQPSVEEHLVRLGMAERLPTLDPTGWEETLKLTVAMAEDAAPLLRALAEANLALAGQGAAQSEARIDAAVREELRQRLLARSRDRAADLRARIAAGLALGELGDPRLTPGPPPERGGEDARALLPPFVTIPPGEYRLGVAIDQVPEADRAYFEDAGPAPVRIDAPFAIAAFPVTNAEWARFMGAGGYDDPRWWQTGAADAWRRGVGTGEAKRKAWRDMRAFATRLPEEFERWREDTGNEDGYRAILAWAAMDDTAFEDLLRTEIQDERLTEPAFWRNPAFNSPAQPVVGVCWFEALAYCAWLTAEAARGGGNWRFRLPREIEWEGAARGKQGRAYAWGDDWGAARCNVAATRIKNTTPVGVFADGDTPDGISDLSGNVFEWTSTLYRPGIDDPHDGREDPNVAKDESGEPFPRAVRGGSWGDAAAFARGACRGRDVPGIRYNNLGFRLVRVSHP